MRSTCRLFSLLFAGLAMLASGGCWGNCDLPFPWTCPIPVPQLVGDQIQEHMERDYRETPIMPPVRDYAPVFCMDPPTEYDIVRVMRKPSYPGKIPYLYEKHYNRLRFEVQKIVDHIDECRFYPLVGPAQLHHCHWECVVYYNELVQSDYPFPIYVRKPRVQVIYIDKDHLHLYVGPDPETQRQITQDLTRY